MATCKECLHQCYTEDTSEVEQTCNFFLDKSKYEPVKHGSWKYIGYEDGVHPKDVYECTNCGKREKVVCRKYLEEFKCCRECGAKMDLEVDSGN